MVPILDMPQVWDLGGQANLRPSWATYYRATDAVIVVIDSTDRARASIAKVRGNFLHPTTWVWWYPILPGLLKQQDNEPLLPQQPILFVQFVVPVGPSEMLLGPLLQAELFTLLEHEHLQEAAILIMANKQDLKDAMNVKEMTDVLSPALPQAA